MDGLLVAATRSSGSSDGYVDLVLVGAALVVGYLVSLWLHPWTACRSCSGAGRHRGGIYWYAWGDCPRCGGSGRKLRAGVRALGIRPRGQVRK